MERSGVVTLPVEDARQRLIDAERRWVTSNPPDFEAREDRDDALVLAIRSGVDRDEIAGIVADLRSTEPVGGLLRSVDAIRRTSLTPEQFVAAVRDGRLALRTLASGRRAFAAEDVDALTAGG